MTWSGTRPTGCCSQGRADDQVKVGGRRIELGEVDSALLGLAGVASAAAAVRRTPAGTAVLVGYVVPEPGVELDLAESRRRLTASLPAALVPLLARVDAIPTRGSGKVDRDALPWPLERPDEESAPAVGLTPTGEWVARALDRRARRRGGRAPARTSSRPAAAAWSPRSWSAPCAPGSPR